MVPRDDSLEFLDLRDTTGTKGNVSDVRQVMGEAGLERSTGGHYGRIVIVFCCGHDNNPSTTQLVLVFNLEKTSFSLQVFLEVENITLLTSPNLGHLDMNNVHTDRVV